jgi:hypothetical protein
MSDQNLIHLTDLFSQTHLAQQILDAVRSRA